jgi:hypothetical protein
MYKNFRILSLPRKLFTKVLREEICYQKLLSSTPNKNPSAFFKKWGLVGLLQGPAFRFGVAGNIKAKKRNFII